MPEHTFDEFRESGDTLRVYKDGRLLFASDGERLLPLVEYIQRFEPHQRDVIVFDRVTGNAASLLLTRISCRRVHSDLGSRLAAETLRDHGIDYEFEETVPYIENNRRDGMCPMEELSLDSTPDEFYRTLLERISGGTGQGDEDGPENG